MTSRGDPDVTLALSAYAQGLFPMDDPAAQGSPLAFYRADPRAVFDLAPHALEATRRRVRRSLARDPGWEPATDRAFTRVVEQCARPRAGDGVWLTPRLARLYERLHAAGVAHSFELWQGDTLAAGVLGVVLGRAALLESMCHTVPHAGNVNVVRTLERLAAVGVELCDIQLISDHTRRLGAVEIPARDFERRLRRALRR
ncbi:MAG: leucyl/phenylalanyl-tRNA--protein transferase [Solirubrobacteraceae bacterium]